MDGLNVKVDLTYTEHTIQILDTLEWVIKMCMV
jgi:hypothetical protein